MLSTVSGHFGFAAFSHVLPRAAIVDGKFEFKDKKQVEAIFAKYPADRKKSAILPLLHLAQQQNGFLNRGCIEAIAKLTEEPVGRVHETATFYHMYRFKKPRKHRLERCNGLSCYIHKGDAMKKAIEKATQGTFANGGSKDGEFDLIEVECLGACASAPVVIIDDLYYTHLDEEKINTIVNKIKKGQDATEFSCRKVKTNKPTCMH